MDKKTITVTVSGQAGSGKTTIAALIAEVLKTRGLNVQLNTVDNIDPVHFARYQDARLKAIQSNADIVINELSTRKESIFKED